MGIFNFFSREKSVSLPAKVAKRSYRAPRANHIKDGFMPRDSWERAPSALATIRARSRDLVHNNPYASRAVSLLTSYVVGTGISYGISGNTGYAKAFRKWSLSRKVDYYGRLNIHGIQHLCARMMFEAGEAFIIIRMVEDEDGSVFPQFQCVDPSLVADGASPQTAGNTVDSGVEISRATGRVVGYHFKEFDDPMMIGARSNFIPASQVVHLFEVLYPGQIRGVPRGSQALIAAEDVDSFISTMLIKARAEACISIFVRSTAGNEYEEIGDVEDGDETPLPETLSPGSIVRLREGEDISAVNPSSSGGFIDFVQVSLQSVAISYRVTYTLLSGDLGKTSFSSMKSDRDLFAKSCDETREIWIYPFLDRLEEVFREAYELNTGEDVDVTVSYIPPSRLMIDPQKETYAQSVLLRNGVTSYFDAIRATGKDPVEHMEQLKAERDMAKSMGIDLGFMAPEEGAEAPTNPGEPVSTPDAETSDEEDNGDEEDDASRDPAEDDEA